MSRPSQNRFVIGSVALLYFLISVSSFAQNAGDSGAHYRDLAASNRSLAAEYRNRAQAWRDLAQKARSRQSKSNSAAMKQILGDQIAQDEKEAAQASAEANRLEQTARDFDQKAQEASGTGEVHGPTLPLGGSEASGGAVPAPSGTPSIANAPLGEEPHPQASAAASPSNEAGGSVLPPPSVPPELRPPNEVHGPTVPLGGSVENGGAAPNRAPPMTACPAEPKAEPIKLEELAGQWTDAGTGEPVELRREAYTSNVKFIGRHTWSGDYSNGTLKLWRYPDPLEMGAGPTWAKDQERGRVKWELELQPTRDCGELVLKGKWYRGQFKYEEQRNPASNQAPKESVSDLERGTPLEVKYSMPPPAIAGVIVLDDQQGSVGHGVYKHPYPDDQRTLFIFGRRLPRDWGDPVKFENSDPAVHYMPIAFEHQGLKIWPIQQDQFRQGWEIALAHLDSDTKKLVQNFDAMLVRVNSNRSGVLAGQKDFTLNGLPGTWFLAFGANHAYIEFMQHVEADVNDRIGAICLPQQFFIQVRTEAKLPLKQIRLRLRLNDRDIHWAGGETLVARQTDSDPTLYRTSPIELASGSQGGAVKGAFVLPAKAGDQIHARLDDEFLADSIPQLGVKVVADPSELGTVWKSFLQRAARTDGKDPDDWATLSNSKAAEVANIIVTELKRVKVSVTVGEHAALLMLRDEFVSTMNSEIEWLSSIDDNEKRDGLLKTWTPDLEDTRSYLNNIRVTAPGGGTCPLDFAINQSYLDGAFKNDRQAQLGWVRRAVAEAVETAKQDAKYARDKAQAIKDDDIAGLADIVAFGVEPLFVTVRPRLMRQRTVDQPTRVLWAPDTDARYCLLNVRTTIDAISAQKDYSHADTRMVIAVGSAIAAPAAAFIGVQAGLIPAAFEHIAAGIVAEGLGLGFNVGVPVATAISRHEEVKFGMAASLVLGGTAIDEADIREAKMWEAIVEAGTGVAFAVVTMPRIVGQVRTALVISKVGRGGLQALKDLPLEDQAAFWRMATDAERLRMRGIKLSAFDQKVAEVSDSVKAQMGLPKSAPFKKVIDALGDGGAALSDTLPGNSTQAPAGTTQAGNSTAAASAPAAGRELEKQIVEDEAALAGLNSRGGTTLKLPPEEVPRPPASTEIAPKAGFQWVTRGANGTLKVFKLGEKLGEGATTEVFALNNWKQLGCKGPCVIKIYRGRAGWFGGIRNAVRNILKGAGLLKEAGIEQLEVIYADLDAGTPFLIQEQVRDDMGIFVREGTKGNYTYFWKFGGQKTPIGGIYEKMAEDKELQHAFFEFNQKLVKAKQPLSAEDGHLLNVYFRKTWNGKWVCGMLDQDRLIVYTEREGPMGAWFARSEYRAYLENNSLRRSRELLDKNIDVDDQAFFAKHMGPHFRSAEEYMEQQFYHRQYITSDGKKAYNGVLELDIVKKYFPNIDHPSRFEPQDPSPGFWSTPPPGWKGTSLEQVRRPIRLARQRSMRLASLPVAHREAGRRRAHSHMTIRSRRAA